jgi:hypothetical protein
MKNANREILAFLFCANSLYFKRAFQAEFSSVNYKQPQYYAQKAYRNEKGEDFVIKNRKNIQPRKVQMVQKVALQVKKKLKLRGKFAEYACKQPLQQQNHTEH